MKAMLGMQCMTLSALLACVAGCGVGAVVSEPPAAVQRSEFLLDQEPAGAISVSEARESLDAERQVVVIGRIGAGDIDPWEAGRAAFFVSDHQAHDHHHGPGHDHENCPFCKGAKSVADSLVIVQFVDEQGKIIPRDARQMLGVAKDQLVVVAGRAVKDDLGNLILTADGIYIKE